MKPSSRLYAIRDYAARNFLHAFTPNTFWLAIEKFIRLAIGLGITVALARYFGPQDFGIYNYALAFFSIVSVPASLGLERVVVRDLSATPGASSVILGTAAMLRVIASVTVAFGAVATMRVIRPDDLLMQSFVGVLAIGLIFQFTDVIDMWFQSCGNMKTPARVRLASLIAVSALKIAAIVAGASIIVFAWLNLLEVLVVATFLCILYLIRRQHPQKWAFSRTRAREIMRDSWPLLVAGLSVGLYMRIDQIMLGDMVGEEAIGLYSAATRLSEVWYVVPIIITTALFPEIVKTRNTDPGEYLLRLKRLYHLLVWLALGIAVTITLVAYPLVTLLYGSAYAGAVDILVIHVWSCVAVFLGVGSTQFLIAENLPHISLYRTLAGLVTNVALNLLLIPRFAGIGAAIATLTSYFVATFSLAFFKKSRGQALILLRSALPIR